MDITELLAFSVKNKASDLHLSAGLPPMIRVHGDVRRINLPPMEHKDVHGMIYDIMNDTQRKVYEEHLEADFSFAVPNLARFRVNAFVQNRGAGAVFRTIPSKVLTLEDLKAPKIFQDIANTPRGIVLGKKSGAASIEIKCRELGLTPRPEATATLLAEVKKKAIAKHGLLTDAEFIEIVQQHG